MIGHNRIVWIEQYVREELGSAPPCSAVDPRTSSVAVGSSLSYRKRFATVTETHIKSEGAPEVNGIYFEMSVGLYLYTLPMALTFMVPFPFRARHRGLPLDAEIQF